MRWGIRRYQNPDGTLTPAGKKRYGEALSKLGSSEWEQERSESLKRAGISNSAKGTDIIKKGSRINRYANSDEKIDEYRKYASLTDNDREAYRDAVINGGLFNDYDKPVSLFMYSAKKDLRIASGEKVAADIIDAWGDSKIKEMYEHVRKYGDVVNNVDYRTVSKKQLDAMNYTYESEQRIRPFFYAAITTHMKDLTDKYSKENYDGFVDVENWFGGMADYPVVLINPRNSMKLERKEEVHH